MAQKENIGFIKSSIDLSVSSMTYLQTKPITNNMERTAVDWLVKKFHDYGTLYYSDITEAKEMEKEQIIEAVMYGDIRGKLETYMTAEEYYNETYNK